MSTPTTDIQRFDVAVIGGGSGGLGAAITAARAGLSVTLIEKSDTLGGNAVRGGVHHWEPGVVSGELPREIYGRFKAMPHATGITVMRRHLCWAKRDQPDWYPGGERVIDPQGTWEQTLQRHGTQGFATPQATLRGLWKGVVFDPHAYGRVVDDLLAETGRCVVRLGTAFTAAQVESGRIISITLDNGQTVIARTFIDATADVHLARAAGCRTRTGRDPQSAFGEPSAPLIGDDQLNAVTLIYRVTPRNQRGLIEPPPDVGDACWWRPTFPVSSVVQYPRSDLNINMLPTMEGREAASLGHAAAMTECRRRVWGHWRHWQRAFPEFQTYDISWIAPALGVRESHRVVARYTLTEHDLRAGLSAQTHNDVIALADHALDVHGQHGGVCNELNEPYGIPYRCLLPADCENLLVACRGAGFSAIAASSCRLSRTMMSLGEAAGAAAAMSQRLDLPLSKVPASLAYTGRTARRRLVQP